MLHYLDRFEFIHAHESKQKLTYIKTCVYKMADMHFFLIYTLLRWSPLTAEFYLSSGKTRGKLELGPGFTDLALTGNNDLTICV